MKRKTALVLITLLVALALSFTQSLAAGTNLKKTPMPQNNPPPALEGQPNQPGSGEKTNGADKPGKENAPGQQNKAAKGRPNTGNDQPGSSDENGQPDTSGGEKQGKGEKPDEKLPEDQAKSIHLRGKITNIEGNIITLLLPNGRTITVTLEGASIHIPKLGKDAGIADLKAGAQITLKAIPQPGSDAYQALNVSMVPGKPAMFHRVGNLEAYMVDGAGNGSLTINGQEVTITPDTVILPKGASVEAGALVTVVCPRDASGGQITAKAIIVHPKKAADQPPYP